MAPKLIRPAHLWVPPYETTYGDIAAEVGVQVGLPPDAEQRAVLDAIFAETVPGTPTCFEVAAIAPRQNLKTAVLQIAALSDLFVFEVELHVWSAHLFKTAKKAFEGMVRLVESNPDFARRCRPHRTANGDEAIELKSGERIEFHARSKGGGRGLTGDKVTLDEALFLSPGEVGALFPTMATRPGAQVRYASSAGLLQSDVLRDVRKRGRRGGDPSLGYFEWCAPFTPCVAQFCTHLVGTPGCALDNRKLWRAGNPAFGRRISEEILAKFRRAMPPEEFAREFLGWWDDPPAEGGSAIPAADWLARLDRDSKFGPGFTALGVHITGDRALAYVGAAGAREDGLTHIEIVAETSPAGVVQAVLSLQERRKSPVVVDPGSHAGSLIQPLEDAGVEVVQVTLQKLTQACGLVIDGVASKTLRHIGQAQLDAAVAAAGVRVTGRDSWTWAGNGIAPLSAITLALHGFMTSPDLDLALNVW